MATKSKQPSEIRDYDINLEAADADTIVTVDSVVIVSVPADAEETPTLITAPGGHPASQISEDQLTAKIWLGGGTDGVKYKVTTVLTTTVGRVLEHDFNVNVRNK